MGGKNRIYWDTCIFIAHLSNEVRSDPLDQLGIQEIASLFDMGQIDLVTSTITFVEFMEGKVNNETYELFRKLFSRKNIHLLDVNKEIAILAGEIRSYHRESKSTVSTPDCIHIATAIYFDSDVFYTFDGSGSHPGILDLSTPIAGKYDIKISKPRPAEPNPQLNLNI